jgi:uncharacterized repeat protein (TIGR03803 family)
LTVVAGFGLTPFITSGTEFVVQTLFEFQPTVQGAAGPLVDAGDGHLYGLGYQFGGNSVFEITTNGEFTIICGPIGLTSGLMMGRDGNLYVTADDSVYRLTRDGHLTTLVTFNGTNGIGCSPTLSATSNGDLYGTTAQGGPDFNRNYGFGTVFKVGVQGTSTTVVAFNGTNGAYPIGRLIQGTDGTMYGITQSGGLGFLETDIHSGFGTLFRVAPTGEFRTLLYFDGSNGVLPQDLVLSGDGALYVVSSYGGKGFNPGNPRSGFGTILKLDLNGSVLGSAQFDGTNGIGSSVYLTLGNNGKVYGTTAGEQGFDGANPWSGFGSLFTISTDGSIQTIVKFNGFNGASPESRLVLAADGNLYGASLYGGLGFDGTNWWSGFGTIFKLTSQGNFMTLVEFNGSYGSHPYFLTPGVDGNVYGTTDETLFWTTPDGTLTTLRWFADNQGFSPAGGLVQGIDGKLYGTTSDGGFTSNDAQTGRGTLFSITSEGSLNTLFTFPASATNGTSPLATLLLASDGNLYGTTVGGGQFNSGTVFKFATNGTLTTLFSFAGTNGERPSRLVQGQDGNFYGTTGGGGIGSNGTVFKLRPDGNLTTLFFFDGDNGSYPGGGLTLGTDGNFYGTTISAYGGPGGIFRVAPSGGFTQLYLFTNYFSSDGLYLGAPEGDGPFSELVQGSDGNFYGVTAHGGKFDLGTVFKITTNGTLTSLASFDGTNGAVPWVGLAKRNDGNFYGATFMGGPGFTGRGGNGTIFQITPSGTLRTLVSFPVRAYLLHDDPPEGVGAGNLMLGSDGNIYGVRRTQAELDKAGNLAGFGGSIFRLVPRPEITSMSGRDRQVTLTWSAFSGGAYRVESALSLSSFIWSSVTTNVIATGSTASATTSVSDGAQVFYRVRLLP